MAGKTDWVAELEKFGITPESFVRDPKARAKALQAKPLPEKAPSWIRDGRITDDTLIDPTIPSYYEPEDVMADFERRMGPERDLLYNAGITHILFDGETEGAVGVEHIPDLEESGRYFDDHGAAITEWQRRNYYNTDILAHEAGHALSYFLSNSTPDSAWEILPNEAKIALREDVQTMSKAGWRAMQASDHEDFKEFSSPDERLQNDLAKGKFDYDLQAFFLDGLEFERITLDPVMKTQQVVAALNQNPEMKQHFPALSAVIAKHPALEQVVSYKDTALRMSQHPVIAAAIDKDYARIEQEGYARKGGTLSRPGVPDKNAHHYLPAYLHGRWGETDQPKDFQNFQAREEAFAEVFSDILMGRDDSGLSAFMPHTRKEIEGLLDGLRTIASKRDVAREKQHETPTPEPVETQCKSEADTWRSDSWAEHGKRGFILDLQVAMGVPHPNKNRDELLAIYRLRSEIKSLKDLPKSAKAAVEEAVTQFLAGANVSGLSPDGQEAYHNARRAIKDAQKEQGLSP